MFTEYADTKRCLTQILQSAVEACSDAERRILGFHGAMSDDQREQVQSAFNADPEHEPARILVATDAAREGLNLQSHCAHLFHFDVPWNPARLEQRNGRIDRTLQPSDNVWCHYFVYPDRAGDAVLDRLVEKIDRIQRELGTLGEVVVQRVERALSQGIRASSRHNGAIEGELETEPAQLKALYEVVLTRREPVGLVSRWPATKLR